ncbi:MAG: class I adenylate-forming enzyme family protein [Actinomycetota bacterium]|nr:class I adenylate-forming enzyme family protein [Actinomycetota bacterium]
MTHPTFGDDPRLDAIHAATRALCAPGAPFETVAATVLGEEVEVFADRPRTLRQMLESASAFGDAECYVFSDGRRVTFGQLPGRVASVMSLMADSYGLGRGSRIAIAAANCPEWIVAFWAATAMGAEVVAMNGWWTGPEMGHALTLTEPDLVLLDEKRAERLGTTSRPTAMIGPTWYGGDPDRPLPPPEPVGEDDPALAIFTSGTTGRPKAAVLSHRGVIGYLWLQKFMGARSAALAPPATGTRRPMVRLAPYPLFHVSGLSMMVGSVMTGSKTVWPLGRFDPAAAVDLTLAEGVNAWGGGSAHVARLLDAPGLDRLPPDQLMSVTVGGSATSPDIIRRVGERFPHLTGTMTTGYGSTETGGLATWAPNWMLAVAPDCVGPPIPTVSIRITDDGGEPLPDGLEGNVEIRSPYTMLGYCGQPEATEEAVRPGRWVRSGDFGRMEEGVLFIVSRRRDLIIRGGENVYPFEIEYRICEHPAVEEAAVFGVDDATFGQTVKAVVVTALGADLTPEEVRIFCSETLAYYKVPDTVEVRTEPLPRNASGKVMKHVLAGTGTSGFSDEEG